MKKTLTLSLVIITTLSSIATALYFRTAGAAANAEDPRRTALQNALSPDLVVPQLLPAGIEDSVLLEAWIRLYNDQDPVNLWDGSTLTGRQLALFALDHGIPVVWDTGNVCRGSSCSQHFCIADADSCDFEDGNPGVDPIYIKVEAQPYGIGMQNLVSTLAHEIFHRTEPFGAVRATRYEEYWAFFVGEKVSKAAVIQFGAYDPLDPAHLNLWVKENRLDGYFDIPEYPASVAGLVAGASSGGSSLNGIPGEAYGVTP